uniref:C-type lectin domain-containing protein n=1 Tax=Cyprinus carpio TaxID=7962 RepID=A0A8C1LW67_CYPCA
MHNIVFFSIVGFFVCLFVFCPMKSIFLCKFYLFFHTGVRSVAAEKNQLETRVRDLTTEKSQLDTRVRDLTAEKKQLETRVRDLTAEKSQLESRFRGLNAEKIQLESRFRGLTAEKSQLESRFRGLTAEKSQLESRFRGLTAEKSQLESRFRGLTAEKSQLESRVRDLTAEESQLETRVRDLTAEKNQLINRESDLTAEKNQLRRDFESLNNKGPISFFMSTERKSWSDSRQYCRDRGADLVIINTEEKQVSLCECLLMNKRNHTYSFWIGLSDREQEGNMKWVENSPLKQGYTQRHYPFLPCKFRAPGCPRC